MSAKSVTSVTLYTCDDCQPSKATRIYLLKYGVSFVEVNVGKNRQAIRLLVEHGHEFLPVVEYDVAGTKGSWCGFEPEKIEELAELTMGVGVPA